VITTTTTKASILKFWGQLHESFFPLSFSAIPSATTTTTTTTTTKPFVPSIWGRLHELKENYAGSGTWIRPPL